MATLLQLLSSRETARMHRSTRHTRSLSHTSTLVTDRPCPSPPPNWRQRARKKARMFPLLPAYHDGTAPTTAASVIAACKQVCNADPRVTGTLAVAAATAGRGFTTAYRNEVLSRYEMLKLAHILSRVNQRSHTGGVCPTQPKSCCSTAVCQG